MLRPSPAVPAVSALVATAAMAMAACTGEVGTLSVEIVTAPGSTVLATATRLRATLSAPRTVVEADRGEAGFDLDLEVPADGRAGALVVEALDAAGNVVAVGRTPLFPVGAITAEIAVYLAGPGTLAAAPVALTTPRRAVALTALPFGALIAGGRDGAGVPIAAVDIYNVYIHDLQPGAPMPAPRSELAVAAGAGDFVYLMGGVDAAGTPSGELLRFDTSVAPAGSYQQLDNNPALARSGHGIAPLGFERFLVTGEPVALFEGLTGAFDPLSAISRLPPVALTVQNQTLPDAPVYTVAVGEGAGASGIVRLAGAQFSELGADGIGLRTGHGAVGTADARVVVIGGRDTNGLLTSALRIDPGGGSIETIPDALVTAREGAAIAGNGEILLVAGGRDSSGEIVPTAEVFDLATMASLAVIPMVIGRAEARAVALGNAQIAIFGGVDSAGQAIGTIELFTPSPR
ncbi:MAG: hypothetical protein KA297_32365 [Kofleriaceae bacterium]|jgi:hypothetical protein|nr:hypothetical protein [Kofleriaceae bacterium]